MSDTPLLSIDGLAVRIGNREILSDISFGLPEGSITAVLGHNGAGKSTLLRTVMGLLPTWKGTIRLDGAELGGTPVSRSARGLGMVPQATGTFPNLTVAENLELARGRNKAAAVDTSAIFPELTKLTGRTAETLSGGQRQMVAVAMEFIRRPRVLLLDEPTLGVQPSRVASMMAAVARYREEHGTTVLLVEQDFERVRALADKVVILNNGRTVLVDDAANLESEDVIGYL